MQQVWLESDRIGFEAPEEQAGLPEQPDSSLVPRLRKQPKNAAEGRKMLTFERETKRQRSEGQIQAGIECRLHLVTGSLAAGKLECILPADPVAETPVERGIR